MEPSLVSFWGQMSLFLDDTDKLNRFVRLWTWILVIVSYQLFWSRCRCSNWNSITILSRIFPFNMLPSKFRDRRFDKFPVDVGIRSESELLDRSRSFRLLNFPIEWGNFPVARDFIIPYVQILNLTFELYHQLDHYSWFQDSDSCRDSLSEAQEGDLLEMKKRDQ